MPAPRHGFIHASLAVLPGATPRADHSRHGRGHGKLRAARPPGSARAPAAAPLTGTHGSVTGRLIAEDNTRMRVAAHRADRLRRRGDERRIRFGRRDDLPMAGVRRGTAADITVQIEIRGPLTDRPMPLRHVVETCRCAWESNQTISAPSWTSLFDQRSDFIDFNYLPSSGHCYASWWRWRESNPRPPAPTQGFSGRSLLVFSQPRRSRRQAGAGSVAVRFPDLPRDRVGR